MTDHYFKAERLLEMAGTHTNTGDERDAALAALFAARAQAHATLALATRPDEQAEPEAASAASPRPEAVPLWRAAETWGDDIEVKSLHRPNVIWRVRGGKLLFIGLSGVKWLDVTERSVDMVTLVSREPYRDDPWAPGTDVTARLAAGETAPEGAILADCEGDLYRVTQSGSGASWSHSKRLWYHTTGLWSWGSVDDTFSWANYTPIHVATPEQIRAAGIEEQS